VTVCEVKKKVIENNIQLPPEIHFCYKFREKFGDPLTPQENFAISTLQ
jgi:hypothetical protein